MKGNPVICKPCASGADHYAKFKQRAVADTYHQVCLGCDCQHRTDIQAAGKTTPRKS
jgi:hypothetical protein